MQLKILWIHFSKFVTRIHPGAKIDNIWCIQIFHIQNFNPVPAKAVILQDQLIANWTLHVPESLSKETDINLSNFEFQLAWVYLLDWFIFSRYPDTHISRLPIRFPMLQNVIAITCSKNRNPSVITLITLDRLYVQAWLSTCHSESTKKWPGNLDGVTEQSSFRGVCIVYHIFSQKVVRIASTLNENLKKGEAKEVWRTDRVGSCRTGQA